MTKQPQKSGPLRADDFPAPKRVSEENLSLICRTYSIPASDRQLVRSRLDELVEQFKDWMTNERSQSDRAADRERLKTALSSIKSVIDKIGRLGPSGRLALQAMSNPLAPMLSAQWIHNNFPDDDYAPQSSPVARQTAGQRTPAHTSLRAEEYFIEEHSLESRLEFVSHRAVKTTTAVLTTASDGLERTLQRLDLQPGSRGGRKPLTFRHYLIINLAVLWDKLGNEVVSGAAAPFPAFCESVAESIGWPTEGTDSAVPDAIIDWRNRTRKNRR